MIKINNIEKRLGTKEPIVFSIEQGLIKVLPLKRDVYFKELLVQLTKNEYDVLWFLIKNKHQIFSRDQLLNQLFSESEAYERVIDVYIKNIRKKLSDEFHQPELIKTHYGFGYQFVGEIDEL